MFAEDRKDTRPLYLYVKTEDTDSAWIVAFLGHREVLKSPILVRGFINESRPSAVQTVLANTANRKPGDPITRHYNFEFGTELEA